MLAFATELPVVPELARMLEPEPEPELEPALELMMEAALSILVAVRLPRGYRAKGSKSGCHPSRRRVGSQEEVHWVPLVPE